MKATFFGSGSPLSAHSLREIAARHDVPLVILPVRRLGRRARLKKLFGIQPPPTPLEEEATRLGLRIERYEPRRIEQLAKEIRAARTEIIAVASFPAILPPAILEIPGINLHSSLLPRHRGVDPLFWTFHADDRESGVTIHWLDAGVDSGDIISQAAIPVTRGITLMQLYTELSRVGGEQLAFAIDAIESGTAQRMPQDPAKAQRDPSPLRGKWRVESDHWPSERTWHFLRGVGDMYGRFCRDAADRPLPMGAAREYKIVDHGKPPGTSEETAEGLRLYCRDGVVDVSPATR